MKKPNKLKVIITGYEGTKELLPASSYLIDKYFGGDQFDIYFVSFGPSPKKLFCGRYNMLSHEMLNKPKSWANYMYTYFSKIQDEYIIYGQDDFLLSGFLDLDKFYRLWEKMNEVIVCARLCTSDFFEKPTMLDKEIKLLPQVEFTVTGQYCIWNRQYFVYLLSKMIEQDTTDPWEFEVYGSKVMNQEGKRTIGTDIATLPYPTRSAISKRWGDKIWVAENPLADIEVLISEGLLDKDKLLYD